MKQHYFDYAHRLAKYSPLIYQWTQDENLGLFDFDDCMYAPDRMNLIDNNLQWQADNSNRLLIIEQHPFFETDEKYTETKKEILEIADKYSLKIYFLTADYRYWDTLKTNECFYPHWYFELRAHALAYDYKNFNWLENKKYNFSCNNMSNYRSEKIYNYIECFRRKRSDWLLSIYDHPHAQISTVDVHDIGKIKQDQIDIWDNEIKHTIKMYEYDLYNQTEPRSAMNTLFPGHVDAHCNLVMENSMEIEILSEKSFKSFLARQIPVYLAHAGACTMLRKLGFDLFYDFVDHEKYDNIGLGTDRFPEYWINRIDQVHVLIDNLYTTNFTDFINNPTTKTRLQKNHDYFYSNTIDKMCIEQFNQLLNK